MTMGNWAIRVDNISKLYRIGARVDRHATLRDQISEVLAAPFRRNHSGGSADTIWALKDVSFEVPRGEVVGIIGRNGAGKSTLLKILSRITEPTRGCAEIAGRVGSLLEVGTGFHPELTGRENIYLNGAILGMRRAEINSKFDEIVAFAEIDKFIDTPVKRYSSGMYVRLAFAVAAHLEPEILIVDEVLAVGDAAFQKKCLGKMGDVAKQGRTVLFVSHNMAAVGRLCGSALWLDRGEIVERGDARSVIGAYLSSSDTFVSRRSWDELETAPGDEYVRVLSVGIVDAEGGPCSGPFQDRPFIVAIKYRVLQPMMNANVGFELKGEDGTIVLTSFDADNAEWSGRGRGPGVYWVECLVPALLLNEGTFYLTVTGGIPHFRLCVTAEDVLAFKVGPPLGGDGPSARMGARRPGLIAPDLEWRVSKVGQV